MLGQASTNRELKEEAVDAALEMLEDAITIVPNDANIERERTEILRWRDQLVQEWMMMEF